MSSWIQEAGRLPLAFAQVREDSRLDARVADLLPTRRARVCLIASGGCTAALLSRHPGIRRLSLVDANPAQIALTRLKLRLIALPERERARLLGHQPMPVTDRQEAVRQHLEALNLSPESLGPPAMVARLGPDYAGRYERCFAELATRLRPLGDALLTVLEGTNTEFQSAQSAPDTPLGQHLEKAFDDIFSLPHLETLFGPEATRNPAEPFARHFLHRCRWVLRNLPAQSNPWLWQMLAGRNPPRVRSPWLEMGPAPVLAEVDLQVGRMADFLEGNAGHWDFIHLSNIMDWLSPEQAAHTLSLAFRALRPGGFVFLRQLNSGLDIRALGGALVWREEAEAWHAVDRSFFYRQLHLGQRP